MKIIKLLWESLAIVNVKSLFDHDAHSIVSKKGQLILKQCIEETK